VVVVLPSANIQTQYVKCRPGHIHRGYNKHLVSSVPVLHKAVNTGYLSWWQGQTLIWCLVSCSCASRHTASVTHFCCSAETVFGQCPLLGLCHSSITILATSVILLLAEIMLMQFCTLNVCKVQFLMSCKCGCTVLKDEPGYNML
jgi:hypothetical protein